MSSCFIFDSRRMSKRPFARSLMSEPSCAARGESRSPDPDPDSSSDILFLLDVPLTYQEVH